MCVCGYRLIYKMDVCSADWNETTVVTLSRLKEQFEALCQRLTIWIGRSSPSSREEWHTNLNTKKHQRPNYLIIFSPKSQEKTASDLRHQLRYTWAVEPWAKQWRKIHFFITDPKPITYSLFFSSCYKFSLIFLALPVLNLLNIVWVLCGSMLVAHV